MNYRRSMIVVCLFFVVTSGWSQPPKRPGTSAALLVGEYMRDDYLDTLRATGSPFASLRSGEPQLVIVKKSDGGRLLSTILDFHQGGAEFRIPSAGPLQVQIRAGFEMSNLHFEEVDPRHFKLGFDQFAALGYTYVGDSSEYARRVLTGEYTDKRGKRYTFGSDGVADFDGMKFKYSIGLDQVLNRFDYFQDDVRHEVIGFKRTSDTLSLFHTSGEISQYLDKSPYLVLRKIR
jgi:hypothetical protein